MCEMVLYIVCYDGFMANVRNWSTFLEHHENFANMFFDKNSLTLIHQHLDCSGLSGSR